MLCVVLYVVSSIIELITYIAEWGSCWQQEEAGHCWVQRPVWFWRRRGGNPKLFFGPVWMHRLELVWGARHGSLQGLLHLAYQFNVVAATMCFGNNHVLCSHLSRTGSIDQAQFAWCPCIFGELLPYVIMCDVLMPLLLLLNHSFQDRIYVF